MDDKRQPTSVGEQWLDHLDADDVEELRKILEKERRWRWLATLTRNTASWVAVVVGGAVVVFEVLPKLLKVLMK